ncbi:MAG TPA: DUF6049 family protein [Nocardioides sp.]|nr:DUF6049 family protein [Nocardioides sp.]
MVRRPTFLRAFVAVVGLVTVAVATPAWTSAPAGASEPGPPGTPLLITIDSLTPGAIPEQGPIRIRGSVTNRDDEAWSAIDLYPFISTTPIQSRAGLTNAAALEPDEYVGDRILEVEGNVNELQPGSSSTFSITVPRSLIDAYIGGAPGVYWFGVHAIGSSDSLPRDTFADGRARTFVPLVPPRTKGAVKTALVVPLRRFLGREADGSISDPEAWHRSLSPEGRLREAVEFGAAAGPGQVSYLVDPALPDAVRRLAGGNPPRSLAPTDETTEPGESPSPSPTDDEEGEEGEEEEDSQLVTPEMETADTWLAELESVLQAQELLTLPYGDLDLAGAADHDPALIELAGTQVSTMLAEWGLTGSPVVGSPSGYLDAGVIDATDPEASVLLSDRAFVGDAPGVASLDGRKLVFVSSGASSGGPAPGDRVAAVALRQRILSEAALRVLEPGRRDPLVVVMPAALTSLGAEEFFAGLDVGWVDLTTLTDATARNGRSVGVDDLTSSPRQDLLELDPETFEASDALIADGETLQNLLTRNDEVAAEIAEEALTGVSYTARQAQLSSRAGLNRSRAWVLDRLQAVEISAPPGVTLSSATGDFVATVTNRLDQPVTVSIDARSNRGMTVTPPETVELAPKSRTSVLLQARTSQAAVHNVTLLLTDADGTPLGSSDRLPIRSAQVSNVIWVIMGAGVLLLFGAILLRLFRRIRGGHREEPTEPTEPTESTDAADPVETTT